MPTTRSRTMSSIPRRSLCGSHSRRRCSRARCARPSMRGVLRRWKVPQINRATSVFSRWLMRAAGAIVVVVWASTRVGAQVPVLIEGLVDGEFWSTSTTSNLLTRNAGRPAGLARLQVWSAIEPVRRFVVYGQTTVETGDALTDATDSYHASVEQFGLRFTVSPAFVVDGGRLTSIVGTFAPRRFSNRNPLIGTPDGYVVNYPYGAMVSGVLKRVDYRVAMVSQPVSHPNYVPMATAALRPAAGLGITPMVGLRLGGSFTVGPYLNDTLPDTLLAGQSWDHYKQRVVALDARFSRGYLETHVEAARGSYEVPGRPSSIFGYTYYAEAKYTLSPRVFVAGRAERNKYPFIRANAPAWVARVTDFVNGEVGVGYRLRASTLVKASVRGDRWWVAQSVAYRGLGGGAVALQVSQGFDAMSWFARDR